VAAPAARAGRVRGSIARLKVQPLMRKPAAHHTTLLTLATITAAVASLAVAITTTTAAATTRHPAPCAAATDRTYLAATVAVARQISAGESGGSEVTRAVQTIEADRVLANAVAGDDLPAVRSEVLALVFNHEHIVRLRVLRDGVVLDDFGGPFVTAPISGSLTLDGRVVGTFVMSIQDDAGYQKLVQRLDGADTVLSYQGATVLANIAPGDQTLPPRGTVVLGGVSYLVASFSVPRFPNGRLNVSLLLPSPAPGLARQSCPQVAADVLAGVAQRVYGEAMTSPFWVGGPLKALARSTSLAGAVAAGDYAGASQIVSSVFAEGGFAGLDVVVDGRVVAGAGGLVPSIAPVTRPLVDGAGALVGQAVFAVETAEGYTNLAHAFLIVPVLVRAGAKQLAGTFAGPATLPPSGSITYHGVHYVVASFAAVEFPSVPARVYLLMAD
jgi:hypothetical protein